MPRRRKKKKFQQLAELNEGGLLAFEKEDFPNVHVQQNSYTVMGVWKQWTDEHHKTGSGWQKIMSACDNWHLFCMAVNDCTVSSRQLIAHWFTATSVLMSVSSICWHLLHHELHARVLLYRILLLANYQQLHLQWAHEHRDWQTDWHQVFFNLWDHDGCIYVRC